MEKRRGFTLIELLVVISIIAVLMSVMMPALQKARAMAKMTICQSNIKQISNAALLYAAEMGGKLPPNIALRQDKSSYNWPSFMGYEINKTFSDHPLPNPKDRILANYLGDRVGDGEIFYCPMSPPTHRDYIVNLYGDINYANDSGYGSYTCSYGIFWGGYTFYTLQMKKIEFAKSLSSKPTDILCADILYNARDAQVASTHPFDGGLIADSAGVWKATINVRKSLDAITSSKHKSNYAFMDGHVEGVRGSDTDWLGTTTTSDYNRFYFPKVTTGR